MKTVWLECATGVAGDMLLAALLDAGVPWSPLRDAIGSLGLPDVEILVTDVHRCGFRAKHVQVLHSEQHAHRRHSDIIRLIERAGPALADRPRARALELFRAIAEAEAAVHGMPLDDVHFHEVGAVDSIVDVVGAAVAFDLLGAERVICAPVPPGRGAVRIAHGVCGVPAPATALLLRGVPLTDVPLDAELTTPTGAAIVRVFATEFGPLPAMTIDAVGAGAGTKDFPDRPNILRVFVGATATAAGRDLVHVLETNLDDVPGELLGYVQEQLLQAGALDVYCVPAQMKKNRPGVILTVLCRPEDATRLEELLFRETGTLGVRRSVCERVKQSRAPHTVDTPWGPVSGKIAWRDRGRVDFSPEYEDCARVARDRGVPWREVFAEAMAAFTRAPVDAPGKEPRSAPTLASAESQSSPPRLQPHDHSDDHRRSHDHSHSHDHGHDHSHDHGNPHDHSHEHGYGGDPGGG